MSVPVPGYQTWMNDALLFVANKLQGTVREMTLNGQDALLTR